MGRPSSCGRACAQAQKHEPAGQACRVLKTMCAVSLTREGIGHNAGLPRKVFHAPPMTLRFCLLGNGVLLKTFLHRGALRVLCLEDRRGGRLEDVLELGNTTGAGCEEAGLTLLAGVTNYCRVRGLNNTSVFVTLLETRKSKIRVLTSRVLVGNLFLACR